MMNGNNTFPGYALVLKIMKRVLVLIIIFVFLATLYIAIIKVSDYLFDKGYEASLSEEYDIAIWYLEKNLMINRIVRGKEHDRTRVAYGFLGDAFEGKALYDKAIEYERKSLKIALKLYRPDSDIVGIAYNDMGVAYIGKKNFNIAIEQLEKALSIFEKRLSPNHSSKANCLRELSVAYEGNGDLEKASRYLEQGLSMVTRSIEESPYSSYCYYVRGLIYEQKGMNDEAANDYNKYLELVGNINGRGKAVIRRIESLGHVPVTKGK